MASSSQQSLEDTTAKSTKERVGGRFRNLFRSSKSSETPDVAKSNVQESRLSASLWNQLSVDRDCSTRLKAIETVEIELSRRRFSASTLKALWFTVQDLYVDIPTKSGSVDVVPVSSVPPSSLLVLRASAVHMATTLCRSQMGQIDEHFRRLQFDVIRQSAFDHCPSADITDNSSVDHSVSDDSTAALLEWLRGVTNDGQMVAGVEDRLADFLVDWLIRVLDSSGDRPNALLIVQLTRDLLHANAAFVTEYQIRRLLALICDACLSHHTHMDDSFAAGSLNLIDDVLCYSALPEESVAAVVRLNCFLVFNGSSTSLAETSWKVMRAVFRSHWGYSVVNSLCSTLQQGATVNAVPYDSEFDQRLRSAALVGAVYFLGMALWGHARVDTLKYSPSVALHSFLSALEAPSRANAVLAFEVVNAVYRLVAKYGRNLLQTSWDLVLRILAVIANDERYSVVRSAVSSATSVATSGRRLAVRFHDILDVIEQLDEEGRFAGSPAQLFALVDLCSATRPERSVLRMITFKAALICPHRAGWLSELKDLVQRYFHGDRRGNVRIKVVNVFRNVFTAQRRLFPDKILIEVLKPLFADLPSEKDTELADLCLNTLFDILRQLPIDYRSLSAISPASVSAVSAVSNTTTTVNESVSLRPQAGDNIEKLFDILEALLRAAAAGHANKTAKRRSTVRRSTTDDSDSTVAVDGGGWSDMGGDVVEETLSAAVFEYSDRCSVIVCGLSELLLERWSDFAPAHIRRVIHLFCALLGDLYSSAFDSRTSSSVFDEVRRRLWSELLAMRADWRTARLGRMNADDRSVVYSNYFLLYDSEDNDEQSDKSLWTRIAATLELCFDNERCWSVLGDVLKQLQALLLDGRCVVLSDTFALNSLCATMLKFLSDAKRPQQFVEISAVNSSASSNEQSLHLTEFELADLLFPCLSSLLSYKEFLTDANIQQLIATVRRSTLSGSIHAVQTMSVCLLSQSVNHRLLFSPEIVLQLATLAAGPRIAIHVLELASLIMEYERLDEFNSKHYQCVCDIAIAYLDVWKYTTFIVAVAFQLLLVVIVRTPLLLRPTLVKHVIGKLRTSTDLRSDADASTVDSRLVEQQQEIESTLAAFLRHSAYSDAPLEVALPMDARRRCVASKHWLVADTIISLSVVEQCAAAEPTCSQLFSAVENPKESTESPPMVEVRRRHKSAFQSANASTTTVGTAVDRPKFVDDSALITRGVHPRSMTETTGILKEEAITNSTDDSEANLKLQLLEVIIRHPFGVVTWNIADDFSGILNPSVSNYPTTNIPCGIVSDDHSHEGKSDAEGATLEIGMKTNSPTASRSHNLRGAEMYDSVMNRAFFHLCQGFLCNGSNTVPVVVSDGKIGSIARSLRTLDLLSPLETHTIGVVYIAAKQTTETEILSNQFGCNRYSRFLSGLGERIPLSDAGGGASGNFTGGLTAPKDGLFTYSWTDPVTQVVFHVATLIPNRGGGDSGAVAHKKLHIGNDFVTIVYNDAGVEYSLGTISGKFAHVAVVVEPRDARTVAVTLQARDEMSRWLSVKRVVVDDAEAPRLCRRMVLRADTSARVWQQSSTPSVGDRRRSGSRQPYFCRAVERRRHILAVKQRFAAAATAAATTSRNEAGVTLCGSDIFAPFDIV